MHSGNRPRPGPLLAAIPALLAWTFCAAPALHAQDHAQDPLDIVRRSVERDWTDFSSIQNYTYQERNEFRQYARDGRISNTRSETHEILVLHQRPYQRLIARDGRPLSEAEARKEQAKLDREAEKRAHESPAQRARYERDMADERRFIREIPDAFTFRLERTEPVSGQPAWLIDAEPKPGYRAVTSDAKMFARLRAKIWIEQATFHWVKLDAQALSTLSFGFGLLRVAPGGTLRFEQTRVNDEIWLPSSILVRADARLALVKKVRAEFDIRYSGYRKFQSDSRIVTITKIKAAPVHFVETETAPEDSFKYAHPGVPGGLGRPVFSAGPVHASRSSQYRRRRGHGAAIPAMEGFERRG